MQQGAPAEYKVRQKPRPKAGSGGDIWCAALPRARFFLSGLLVICYCLYCAGCLRLSLNLASRVCPSVSLYDRRRCRVLPLFAEELDGALNCSANLRLNNIQPDRRASMRGPLKTFKLRNFPEKVCDVAGAAGCCRCLLSSCTGR